MADTSVSYQCPNCGGPLGYKPGSGDSVKCEYCESEFTSDALEQYFAAQEEAAGNSGFWLDEDAAGTVEAEATLDSESPASVEPTDEQ